MLKFIYNIVSLLGDYLFRLLAYKHSKVKAMVEGRKETPYILEQKIDTSRKVLYMHVSSLGEFEQGRPFLEKFRELYPEWQIVLSFYSPSGYTIRKNYSGADAVVYLPADTEAKMTEFLNLCRPDIAIFVKYDLWPMLLHLLKKRKTPCYLISALFRENQFFFKPYGKPYLNLLRYFEKIYVQNEASHELLAQYNIDSEVTGDTRFDRVWEIAQTPKQVEEAKALRKATEDLILVVGSSWQGDEELLIPYFNSHSKIKMIIAPHDISPKHVQAICDKLERPYIRFSERATQDTSKPYDCLVMDEIGYLSSLYQYGDIAYIGGGFGSGIHNTLEPAVYGLPVLFGPNKVEKFMEAMAMLERGGAFRVTDKSSLNSRLDELINSCAQRHLAGKQAKDYIQSQIGVTTKIINQIKV